MAATANMYTATLMALIVLSVFESSYETRHEFVFAIPTLIDTNQPAHVSITTARVNPVDVIIIVPNTLFEVEAIVSKYEQVDVTVPYEYRLNKDDGKRTMNTFVVKASDEVLVHVLDREDSQGDVFLAIPTIALGMEYYVASYPSNDSSICLSAIQNNTFVNVTSKTGESVLIYLNQFESYRFDGFNSSSIPDYISGTMVKSNKPVAVISSAVTTINNICCLDGIMEQMLPKHAWGRNYTLAPFKDRLAGYVYMVFTDDQASTLIWPGRTWNVTIEPQGYYEQDVSNQIVSFVSDRPVQVMQFMKGYDSDDGGPRGGDPSMLTIPSMSAYTGNITFPVNQYKSPATQLYYINVIIHCSDIDGLIFDDVYSMEDWEQMSNSSMCALQHNVTFGTHSVSHRESTARFAVSVYNVALDTDSSYAYPAAISIPMCSGKHCLHNAHCDFIEDDFYCICDSGYEGDGVTYCEDLNECKEDICDTNAKCENTQGSYTCSCLPGYEGNGFICKDINECAIPGTCHTNATCTNTEGNFTCICNQGYEGDGIQCQEKNGSDFIEYIIFAIVLPIVLAGLSLATIICVCYVCYRRKHKNKSDDESLGTEEGADNEGSDWRDESVRYITTKDQIAIKQNRRRANSDSVDGDGYMIPDESIQGYFSQIPDEECFEIKWNHLMLGKTILGEGSFGEVCEGVVWYGDKGVKVAVKTLKEGASTVEKRDFIKEFDTMVKIGRHPNIVGLVGACDHEGTFFVALELVPHGNLRTLLRKRRERDMTAVRILTLDKMMEIARDVANGMRHLTDIGIIHRDLAARNVLLAEGYIAKVSDFGLSREERIYMQQSKQRVPIRWMAPESIALSTYTTGSDVWSFGVLLWEIGSLGGTPYSKIESRDLLPRLIAGYRMPKPDKCSDNIYKMMLRCWNYEAEKRPSFNKLYDTLDQMLEMRLAYMEMFESPTLTPIDPDRDDM